MTAHQFTHQQVRLWMPTPPSTNNLFRGGEGDRRYKTHEYEAWIKMAGQEIMIQRPRPLPGRIMLDFFHGLRSPTADCSNYVKAAEDLLVSLGLIDGDSVKCVQRVTSCWVPNYIGTAVHITPYDEAAAPWLGFDAGVLGRTEGSPLSAFIKTPQTLGKARRTATGDPWKTGRGVVNKKRI